MSGTKTNIITSIEVTHGTASDTMSFPYLVTQTSKSFDMQEVSADKAYLSRKNLKLVDRHGAVRYIPFRINSQGTARGYPMWRKVYTMFVERQEEFMQHYHKRSNAETVFSMIKRKFSNHLRT